jgi:PAS domain S-box-containing protein
MDLARKNEALEREIEILKGKEYIIESVSIAIVFAALDGMITYVNPAFLKTWGYDNNQEVLGRHFSEFWIPKDIFEKIMDTLQNKGGWSDRIKARKKDGTIFEVHILAAVVFDNAGNPVSMMASSIDNRLC